VGNPEPSLNKFKEGAETRHSLPKAENAMVKV
jgi:hypothetical protein